MNTRLAVISLCLLLVCALCCSKETKETVANQQQKAEQLAQASRRLAEKKDAIKDIIALHNQNPSLDLSEEVQRLDLSPDAGEYFLKRLQQEKKLAYGDLLDEMSKTDSKLQELREQIARLQSSLPEPQLVKAGDNHYDLAMNFLIERKSLTAKQAQQMVERVALFEHLVPGFLVFHFYDGEDYATSILQGEANVSPNTLRKRFINRIIKQKEQALQQVDAMNKQVQELERRKQALAGQIALLQDEKERLVNEMDKINLTSQEQAIRLSSLRYTVGTLEELKERELVSVSIFGKVHIKDHDGIDFNELLDLSQAQKIMIEASDHGLKRISSIYLLPNVFEQGQDYVIQLAPDMTACELQILKPDRFRMERILICLK